MNKALLRCYLLQKCPELLDLWLNPLHKLLASQIVVEVFLLEQVVDEDLCLSIAAESLPCLLDTPKHALCALNAVTWVYVCIVLTLKLCTNLFHNSIV